MAFGNAHAASEFVLPEINAPAGLPL